MVDSQTLSSAWTFSVILPSGGLNRKEFARNAEESITELAKVESSRAASVKQLETLDKVKR